MPSCCACSPTAAASSAAIPNGTSTSSISRSRTSIIRAPRLRARRPTASAKRFHKTALNEFYRVAFRKKVYHSLDELQTDLDVWLREYNESRPHQGHWCFGKTPM